MKNNYLSQVFLALIPSLLLLGLSCSKEQKEPAQPKIVQVTQAYLQDFNNHDIEKTLLYFTDDIKYEVTGGFSLQDKSQIRSLLEWYSVLNEKLTIDEIVVRGDTVSFKLSENNDWLRLLGVGESIFKSAYLVFKGDQISVFKGEVSPESVKGLRVPYSSFLSWAKKERKDRVEKMMPEGRFSIGSSEAKQWRSLLLEWWEMNQAKSPK